VFFFLIGSASLGFGFRIPLPSLCLATLVCSKSLATILVVVTCATRVLSQSRRVILYPLNETHEYMIRHGLEKNT
jgi:hypothetical protein